MNARGEVIGPGAIRFEHVLRGPIERVWGYVVRPELRRTWLADGAMDLRVGGAIEMIWHNERLGAAGTPPTEEALSLSGYRCTGVVTACEPPRLIAFTWDERGVSSEVRIELTPGAPGTDTVELVLTHTRLRSIGSVEGTATGWHTHLDFLEALLDGRPELPSYWSIHDRYERQYADRLREHSFTAPEGCGLLVALPGGGWILEFRRHYSAPIASVWHAVTEPKGLDSWYPAELRFERSVGGALTETFRDEDGAEAGVVRGKVTAFEPPRRFAFEMEGDPSSEHEALHHPQSIRIELMEPEGGGTDLLFEHRFTSAEFATGVAPGWHYCLEFLATHLGEASTPAEGLDQTLRDWYSAWLGVRPA